MATVSSNISVQHESKLSAFFSALATGLTAYAERRSRADQIATLQAKSDEELAKLGLTRDEIPAYVFRDLFYV